MGLVKGLWKIISFKIFNDFFSQKNNSSNEVLKFDVKTLANRLS